MGPDQSNDCELWREKKLKESFLGMYLKYPDNLEVAWLVETLVLLGLVLVIIPSTYMGRDSPSSTVTVFF